MSNHHLHLQPHQPPDFGDLIGEDGGLIHQYDAQADTNAVLEPSGTVEAQYKYYAFGQVAAFSVDAGGWTNMSIKYDGE